MPIFYFYVVCCYLVTIVQNLVCSCFNKLHLNNAITFLNFIILSGLHQNNRRDPICVTLHYQKQSPPPPLYQYVMRSKSDRPSTNMKSKPCRNILAHTILFIDKWISLNYFACMQVYGSTSGIYVCTTGAAGFPGVTVTPMNRYEIANIEGDAAFHFGWEPFDYYRCIYTTDSKYQQFSANKPEIIK